MWYVYAYRNTTNDMAYIGMTNNPRARMRRHSSIRGGTTPAMYLEDRAKGHVFEFIILEQTNDKGLALAREWFHIKFWDQKRGGTYNWKQSMPNPKEVDNYITMMYTWARDAGLNPHSSNNSYCKSDGNGGVIWNKF